MSGLSVRVSDNDGGLSYGREYKVRRILSRGSTTRETKSEIIGMEALGYVFDDKTNKWNPENTTEKYLLVVVCREGLYNEADVVTAEPVENHLLNVNVGTADAVARKYFLLNQDIGSTQRDIDPAKAPIKDFISLDGKMDITDYFSITKQGTDPIVELDPAHEVAGVCQTYRGKRWMHVAEIHPVGEMGLFWLFKQKKTLRTIDYYVLEVE